MLMMSFGFAVMCGSDGSMKNVSGSLKRLFFVLGRFRDSFSGCCRSTTVSKEERLWACEIGCKCRHPKQVSTLLIAEDELEESILMHGHDGDNNQKENKEREAVLLPDSDEIVELIRLQSWVQLELDDHQYHGCSGLAH